jgi:hypothetical protein
MRVAVDDHLLSVVLHLAQTTRHGIGHIGVDMPAVFNIRLFGIAGSAGYGKTASPVAHRSQDSSFFRMNQSDGSI